MATYFSCLALSFFGLQWAEKKRRKQRGSDDDDNNKKSNTLL